MASAFKRILLLLALAVALMVSSPNTDLAQNDPQMIACAGDTICPD